MSNWMLKINRPPHRIKCLTCDEDDEYPECSKKCEKSKEDSG